MAIDDNDTLCKKKPKTEASVCDEPVPSRLAKALGRRRTRMLEDVEELGGDVFIDEPRIIGEADGTTWGTGRAARPFSSTTP